MSIKNQEAIIDLLTEENSRLKKEIEELKASNTGTKKIKSALERVMLRQTDIPLQRSHGGGCGSNGYGGCGNSGGCGR